MKNTLFKQIKTSLELTACAIQVWFPKMVVQNENRIKRQKVSQPKEYLLMNIAKKSFQSIGNCETKV